MKKNLLAACKTEVDPMTVLMICMVITAVLVLGKVFSDRVMTVDDYAMDEAPTYLPAL
jgi:cell division protein FtsL